MNELNNWLFGENCWVDFNGGPISMSGGLLHENEGCAAISDQNGDLLLYTNGIVIRGADHQVISNGSGLHGSLESTSSAIIVPNPDNADQYYVFTTDHNQGNTKIKYSMVEFNMGAPLGEVISKNVEMPPLDFATEKLAVIKKQNSCEGYWLVAISKITGNNPESEFYVYSLHQGANAPVYIAKYTTVVPTRNAGYMNFSPSGNMLAVANMSGSQSNVQWYSFNQGSGAIAHVGGINLATGELVYGVEFSPDENLLYYTTIGRDGNNNTEGHIYQKEMYSPSLAIPIYTEPNDTEYYCLGALKMAPDGSRIYVARCDKKWLGAIEAPNVVGTGCDFEPNEIDLGNGICRLGLPTTVQNGNCEIIPPHVPTTCEEVEEKVEAALQDRCETKTSELKACIAAEQCDCDPVNECTSVVVPEVEPCVNIKWEENSCGGIGSNDYKVMCISVTNCYDNVVFEGFKIGCIEVLDEEGNPIATHPDGTSPIEAIPIGPHCFGNIAPCSTVSREFSVKTTMAGEGRYQVKLVGVCYHVSFDYIKERCFKLKVCND